MKYLNSNGTIKKEKTVMYTATTTFTPERELKYIRERFDEASKKLIRLKWYQIFKRAKLIQRINYCAKRIKELNKLNNN